MSQRFHVSFFTQEGAKPHVLGALAFQYDDSFVNGGMLLTESVPGLR